MDLNEQILIYIHILIYTTNTTVLDKQIRWDSFLLFVNYRNSWENNLFIDCLYGLVWYLYGFVIDSLCSSKKNVCRLQTGSECLPSRVLNCFRISCPPARGWRTTAHTRVLVPCQDQSVAYICRDKKYTHI
ncbi:hypothetical protein NQ318_022101 [Aromia moschata]|uniref:Uncharacterized protein n=1 Tax=Aromia moschata TaxID=1265417 RepID=A0AAV8Z5S5_9CUCU|nr:hypothetical protein NQ318_022101 [Aromia moschata]